MNPITKILTDERHSHIRDETYFHPSEATNCGLAIWFKKKEALGKLLSSGEPLSTNTYLIFRIGDLVHAWLQHGVVELGLCDQSGIEKPFKDEERHITGSIDIFLPERDDMEYEEMFPAGPSRVVDIKTCSLKSFTNDRFPKFEHKVQTSIYCYYMGVEDITIVYICKDGGRFDLWLEETDPEIVKLMGIPFTEGDERCSVRVVHFKKDQTLVDRTFEKFAKIKQCLDLDIPPQPEFEPRERFSPCLSCAYRYHCRKLTGRVHPDLD
jgi:CRISPR/Cas system-associated exonuclease Cas4 (RecB family)